VLVGFLDRIEEAAEVVEEWTEVEE